MKNFARLAVLVSCLWGIIAVLITLPSMGFALTVSGTDVENAAENSIVHIYETVAGSGFSLVTGRGAAGTLASPEATNVRTLLQVGGGGYTGSNWTNQSSTIQFRSSQIWSETGQGSEIRFLTTPNDAVVSGGRMERMRITNDGKVGIGIAVPTTELDVVGTINASTAVKINGTDVLTSYTETDPIYIASAAYNITSQQINNWDAAYNNTNGGITFPDGSVQTTASAPTWHQILPAAERFQSVMGGEAILDRETGLVWAQTPDAISRNWDTAISYCFNLNLGGRKGWRLPSTTELASLVDMSASGSPVLPDGNPFTNVQSGFYWSSTTHASDTSLAWGVHMSGGDVYAVSKAGSVYVWPVRGGQ